ncbi:hypothetical protein CYMTET_52636 [Cymbomonas tetramitiformis]|uniref:Uncharacterized protein n=1 Tax=Cymbomonas tetramitiformis TaxID=36881 RepID=A0AAE0BJR2_9CHLO|nr:hypothetical protein CYMTET_52636 [Cymbomonas tetramitiformis]
MRRTELEAAVSMVMHAGVRCVAVLGKGEKEDNRSNANLCGWIFRDMSIPEDHAHTLDFSLLDALNITNRSNHHTITFGLMKSGSKLGDDGGGDVFITSPKTLVLETFSSKEYHCLGGSEVLNFNTSCGTNFSLPVNGSTTSNQTHYCPQIHSVWAAPRVDSHPDDEVAYLNITVMDGGIYVTAEDLTSGLAKCNGGESEIAQSSAMEAFGGFPGGFDALGGSLLSQHNTWIDDGTGYDAAVIVRLYGPKELQGIGHWVFCTLKAYILLTIRWITAISGSILTPKLATVRARLVPNVCPYCPAAQAYSDIEVQGTISGLFLQQLGFVTSGNINIMLLVKQARCPNALACREGCRAFMSVVMVSPFVRVLLAPSRLTSPLQVREASDRFISTLLTSTR